MKKWCSCTVKSATEIQHNASHPIGGDRMFKPSILRQLDHTKISPARAQDATTKTRAIFLLAAKKPPYLVYCNPFYDHAGCGNIFSVNADGSLKENVQNYEYSPQSAIHGMVFDPSEEYLYSADMWANRIWTHRKDPSTGLLETVGSLEASEDHDQPRWVAMHPSGNYLYALMEHGNTLAEYVIDPSSHLPVWTYRSFPLVPRFLVQKGPKLYRADVCVLSHTGKYLFATSRSNAAGTPGYISIFALSAEGSIERQMALQPTTTGGGHSNAVAPCDWSDEWIALTDDEVGFLEIYRWDGDWLARVARCEVKEPGFGMNAVWWD